MITDTEDFFRKLRRRIDGGSEGVETLQQIAGMLRAAGNYRWVGLYDVDNGRGLISNLVWDGPSPPEYPEFPIGKGLTGRCATQKLSPASCGDFFKPVFMMKTTQNAP